MLSFLEVAGSRLKRLWLTYSSRMNAILTTLAVSWQRPRARDGVGGPALPVWPAVQERVVGMEEQMNKVLPLPHPKPVPRGDAGDSSASRAVVSGSAGSS